VHYRSSPTADLLNFGSLQIAAHDIPLSKSREYCSNDIANAGADSRGFHGPPLGKPLTSLDKLLKILFKFR